MKDYEERKNVNNSGCGFIGSHFTDFQMGYVDMEVIVVDKLTCILILIIYQKE